MILSAAEREERIEARQQDFRDGAISIHVLRAQLHGLGLWGHDLSHAVYMAHIFPSGER